MMTEENIERHRARAGFDLTEMPADRWLALLKEMNICDGVVTEGEKTWLDRAPKYWTWKGEDGFVVTKCNPLSGEHLDELVPDLRPENLSYVGIEGTSEFVDRVFFFIRENASFSKGECYGERRFI